MYIGLSRLTEVMLIKKVSGPSGMLSGISDTCTTWESIPFSNCSMPAVGKKSCPEIAVPDAVE